MLTAGGRAPPFGDLAKGATAAGAGGGAGVQSANLLARGGWVFGHSVGAGVGTIEAGFCSKAGQVHELLLTVIGITTPC
jgi:hypothetical protein